MPDYGSSYSTVKAALVSRLQARGGLADVNVSYEQPKTANDVAAAGSNEAIWLDDADGENDVIVFRSLPAQWEETYELACVIQVLKTSSTGTQQSADQRCDELLFQVLASIADDPTLGVTQSSNPIVWLQVIPGRFRRITGQFATTDGHGARWDGVLTVTARIDFQ